MDARDCSSAGSGLKAPAGELDEEGYVEAIGNQILEGEAEETIRLIDEALDFGVKAKTIVDKALVGSMSRVGRDFKNGEFYVPDVLMASRALQAALFALKKRENVQDEAAFPSGKGTIVVGTVAGDLHDIGKNIAALLFEIEGYTVIDLGIDVVPEVFVAAVRNYHPDILGLSALLTTTVGEMKRVIDALVKAKVRDKVRVYVSGAPVTRELADAYGADHYSPDARDSVLYAGEVCGCPQH